MDIEMPLEDSEQEVVVDESDDVVLSDASNDDLHLEDDEDAHRNARKSIDKMMERKRLRDELGSVFDEDERHLAAEELSE